VRPVRAARTGDSVDHEQKRAFDNGQPYCAIAGELVADFIAFFKLVEAARPEIAMIKGAHHLTIDSEAGTILLGKVRQDGSMVLVERVLVDPKDPENFGASALPVATAAQDPVVTH
jgi:hypothetical protein